MKGTLIGCGLIIFGLSLMIYEFKQKAEHTPFSFSVKMKGFAAGIACIMCGFAFLMGYIKL